MDKQAAESIKKEISKILGDALRGEEKYRHQGFIRWGLVEKEIHNVVEKYLEQ